MGNDVDIVAMFCIWPVPIFLHVDGVIAGTISALAKNIDNNRNGGYRWPITNDKRGLAIVNIGLGV